MTGLRQAYRKGKKWLPTPRRHLLFLRVLAWTVAAPLPIRVLSLPRLLQIATPGRAPGRPDPAAMQTAAAIDVYLNFILSRNPARRGKNCIRRALVMYRFLRLLGVPARFLVGVRKEGDELKGHAWIEIDGQRFLEPEDRPAYEPTFSYPPVSGDNQT